MSTEDPFFPYSSISFTTGPEEITLEAICNGVRLRINVEMGDRPTSPPTPGSFKADLWDLLDSIDEDTEASTNLENLMIQPCFQHIEAMLRSQHDTRDQSLHEYFNLPTLLFQIKTTKDYPDVFMKVCKESMIKHLEPRVSLSAVLGSMTSKPKIQYFPASQERIVREANVSEWERYDMPTVIKVPDREDPLFFKAAIDTSSCVRELEALTRISEIDPSRRLKTSRLAGLVKQDNGPSVVGLLIEYIPGARNLDWAVDDATAEDRTNWMQQIESTVIKLHNRDIIWGDVKPENIVIDLNNQAWVVDFGGGFSEHWVSKELQGTCEGDREGLANIAQFLRLDRNRSLTV